MTEKNPLTGEPEAPPAPLPRLTLSNLGGRDVNGRSGCEEMFQESLSEVLSNIARLDTEATAVREIAIKIKIKPNADRNVGDVEINTSTKLAPLNSAHGRIALGNVFGEQIAVPLQETMPLFDQERAPDLRTVPNPDTKAAASQ